jgi:hypothetical protein
METNNIEWTRINSDVNGNPRFVCHFLDLEPAHDYTATLSDRYARVVRAANDLGGRKYHNKRFGGCIVFQAYECQLPEIAARVRAKLAA